MNRFPPLTLLSVLLLSATLLSACSRADAPPAGTGETLLPTTVAGGEALFNGNCAKCHGSGGRGSSFGPPLVHKIYEPGHHPDAAFYRAAAQGVRAHHWNFGNMAPVPTVGNSEMTAIIDYVRGLQRAAGIH